MKKELFILFSVILNNLNAQVIDFDNFDEKIMNCVTFTKMNNYVKQLYDGDSLILSSVIQKDIMSDNYNFIKNNANILPLEKLHNPNWIGRECNDLPDTIRSKIINEMLLKYSYSDFLKNKRKPKSIEDISTKYPDLKKGSNNYIRFTYTEILGSVTFSFNTTWTYKEICDIIINEWKRSPPHREWMDVNYNNGVIVGVATYYNKKRRTVYVSFVHVS